MFAGINWLPEELEEGLLALLYFLSLAQGQLGGRDALSLEAIHLLAEYESNFLQLVEIISLLYLLDNVHNLPPFSVGIKDGLF